MSELGTVLVKLGDSLGDLFQALLQLAFALRGWLPLGLWVAFWLWAVNWKKLWPTLAQGAWAPAVLIGVIAAAAWSMAAPGDWDWGAVVVPSFVGRLGAVAALAGIALFCGWLQGLLGWTPSEIAIEPPAADHHGHAAAHH